MDRVSLKIVGASGQGINSIGEIAAKGLKRSGYCVFGYREYPSLIKGGHASYQLDCSPHRIDSTELQVNVLVTLNHHGLELNLQDIKEGGLLIHSTEGWVFPPEDQTTLARKRVTVVYLPIDEILQKMGAKPILGNVLIAAFVWAACGQDKEMLKALVEERFTKKKNLLELNMQCIEQGYVFYEEVVRDRFSGEAGSGERLASSKTKKAARSPLTANRFLVEMPLLDDKWKNHLLLTGSAAMGLGAVHAGVRLYAGYPMTPSSPLLSYIADLQNKTGMVIKQAEDEITAAQMVSGAMHMGTRALTATSGGGFDLMSETLSLNGIIENPTVFVLAQRPGPATGLPTWTAQADLLMAVHTAHGEFARCVLCVSDSQDAFDLMPVAFNLAEQYQISVIVLTDKQIAEALYTQAPYDQDKAVIHRHIATETATLQSADRYGAQAENGISPRWLPGSRGETWNAQGDEHDGAGTVDESARNAHEQIEKRMKKLQALKSALPDPELYVPSKKGWTIDPEEAELDLLVVGWGSTKGVALDALKEVIEVTTKKTVGYLHYTYLWPLRTKRFEAIAKKAKKVVLIEGNFQGQLGKLLRMECGYSIEDKILKYDGRPFFIDELIPLFLERLESKRDEVTSVVSPGSVVHTKSQAPNPNIV